MQLRNLQKHTEKEYSLVNLIFSAETATFLPIVFKPTPTQDTQNPPSGPPKQQFLHLVFIVCYFNNKSKEFNQFSIFWVFIIISYFYSPFYFWHFLGFFSF